MYFCCLFIILFADSVHNTVPTSPRVGGNREKIIKRRAIKEDDWIWGPVDRIVNSKNENSSFPLGTWSPLENDDKPWLHRIRFPPFAYSSAPDDLILIQPIIQVNSTRKIKVIPQLQNYNLPPINSEGKQNILLKFVIEYDKEENEITLEARTAVNETNDIPLQSTDKIQSSEFNKTNNNGLLSASIKEPNSELISNAVLNNQTKIKENIKEENITTRINTEDEEPSIQTLNSFQILYSELNFPKKNNRVIVKPDPPCKEFELPIFRKGSRISETKCREQIWKLNAMERIDTEDYICHYNPDAAVGGRDTFPGEFPHMGAVGWSPWDKNSDYVFKCGSSLISPFFLLTAAHCSEAPLKDNPDISDPIPKIVRLSYKNLYAVARHWNWDWDYPVEPFYIPNQLSPPAESVGNEIHITTINLAPVILIDDNKETIRVNFGAEVESTRSFFILPFEDIITAPISKDGLQNITFNLLINHNYYQNGLGIQPKATIESNTGKKLNENEDLKKDDFNFESRDSESNVPEEVNNYTTTEVSFPKIDVRTFEIDDNVTNT
ncbi:uncharacterized protein LOC101742589 isoform X2 [Bombyx mori]|uniref:uncharacterized protein LOC101742589 isoform X2 n=1 Tax=Bombyx mori TaxID=7091 RepID=UPI002ED08B8F